LRRHRRRRGHVIIVVAAAVVSSPSSPLPSCRRRRRRHHCGHGHRVVVALWSWSDHGWEGRESIGKEARGSASAGSCEGRLYTRKKNYSHVTQFTRGRGSPRCPVVAAVIVVGPWLGLGGRGRAPPSARIGPLMEMATAHWSARRVEGDDHKAVHNVGAGEPLVGQWWDG
jgi:hypothetical protein